MSEKDKMLAGELYDANYDKALIEDRYKAKDICFEYNNLKPFSFCANLNDILRFAS